jgi:hypothetical protein
MLLDKYFKQNDGVLIQVIPNFSNENESVNQLIALVHDIADNKMNELVKMKGKFAKKSIKQRIKIILDIFMKHPNVVSYEIYSDYGITCFNFWLPKSISKMFIKQIYNIWNGSDVVVYEKDYIDFNLENTQFTTIRFGRHSIMPLDTESEPLKQLITHLENLDIEEKVLIQFIMQPAGVNWHSDSSKLLESLKKGKELTNSRFRGSIGEQTDGWSDAMFGADYKSTQFNLGKIKFGNILSKMSQKGIKVNIRIGVQSPSKERSESLINGILNIFKIMEGSDTSYNKFIRRDLLPIKSKEKLYNHMRQRRIPIVTLNNADIWVTEEIATFIKMPTSEIESNKINRINIRQTFVPDGLAVDTKLRMGIHSYNGKTYPVYWDIKDMDTLMRPVVVISNPGEGKSEMLKNKFLDWINLGYGAAVIDVSDGKLADQILYALPESEKYRVVLVDCNDLYLPPGLSDFSEAKNHDRSTSHILTQLWTEFYINFFGIDDHHRSKDFIRKSSIPIFSYEENTILEQYLMIKDETFRDNFLKKIKNNRRLFKYYAWWDSFNSKPYKVKAEEVKAILNKFDVLMDNDILKNIICQSNPKVPKFRTLMDNSSIVIIKAGEGAIYYEASRIIGALSLMKFWMAALSRYNEDVEKRPPFKVFCDEPQNYIASGDYVKEMLAKSRKYRLGLEFYFQDPAQIEEKDKYLLKLMVSMNPHLILGKMGDDAYKKYFKDRISPILPKEGMFLPRYHWIVSIYKEKDTVQPFIMKAVDLVPSASKHEIESKKVWIHCLKRQFGTPVEIVEEDILKRELVGFYDNPEDHNAEDDNNLVAQGNATSV